MPCIEDMEIISHATRIEHAQKNSKSIVEYGLISHALKSREEIASKNALTTIEYNNSNKKNKFSTLFCPAGFEFFDIDDDKNIRAGYFILNYN